MALGALDAARDRDITVPDELSVIGFDDIPAAAWSADGLTTVRQPVNRMVEAVAKLLTRQLTDPTVGPETRFLPGQLVRRRTLRTIAL